MAETALNRLQALLRPPGKGLWVHSTGGGYAAGLHRLAYGTEDPAAVEARWREDLARLASARVALIGVPSDVGAGIMRGANFGPIGVRQAYLAKHERLPDGFVDVGDVLCIPHLLHDEMLSEAQISRSREALYPGREESLPVSPLSMAELAFAILHEINPALKIVLIGGDHSVSWPAMLWCQRRYGDRFGVLHFDAHTDLLESRLGVTYCFATWAYHALRLMRPHRMLQVGVRASKFDAKYWMQKYPLKQVWADEAAARENEVISEAIEYFAKAGVEHLYISNDIDATDSAEAPATGTPEPQGLSPRFVKTLIASVGERFEVFGGDVVEVAPPLSGSRDFGVERTSVLASDYLATLFNSMV